MKIDILSVADMYDPALEYLEREFRVHRLWQASDPHALLAEVGARIRGAQATGGSRVDRPLLDSLPKLEIIASFGVGYDGIDVAEAKRRGIVVTNTPSVLDDCVADLAIGLMIAAGRRIPQGDRFVREGRWLAGGFPLAHSVSRKRLGIVGLGRIGRAIAARALGFAMTIAYHNRRRVEGSPHAYYDRLVDLARDVDFLVIVTPGGPATLHLVNEEVMRALGPQGILVNVSRGSVVDEQALVRCLQSGALGGAALDVFEEEPNAPAALLAMENVVLQPHVGSATHETRAAMGRLTVDNLRAHFAGRPLLSPVG